MKIISKIKNCTKKLKQDLLTIEENFGESRREHKKRKQKERKSEQMPKMWK